MNITPRDIVDRLKNDMDAVCKYLLPGGKRSGSEWEVGSTAGEAGKSLKIHLSGDKAGVWSDFATSQSGDVLDLWCAVRGIDLGQAIREAKSYLGITDPDWEGHKPRQYTRPERPKKARKPTSAVTQYFAGRGITEATLKAFRIAEEPGAAHFSRLKDNPATIVFPFLRDDELIAVKYLAIQRIDGKKQTLVEKGCEPCLFGWQALPSGVRNVALTEGEIDAMTLQQFGIAALSVPMGAGNHQWIEYEYERLERFDQIFLCFDQDGAGQKAVGELVERLGRHRCRIVRLGHKDANECLQRGWTVKQFADAFMAAKTMDPQALRCAADYVDEVVAEFYPPPDRSPGLRTPWQKVGENLLFRAAEVSLWTGYNGHGKSQALNFVMAHAMACGARVCIASMELPPRRLLYRLTKQLCGTAEPSIPYIRAAHRWLEDRLWLFDAVGTVKAAHILEVFAYARQRYRVTHFVLDSLSKCGLAEDDYNGQKALVEGLCDFAHAHNVHVYLVAHARKGHDERGRPGKMDVKGTGALTDMVDTVITVWRNKAKEEGLEEARINGEEVTEEFLSKPDGSITVSKQRNGSWEGTIALWFDPDTLQYHGAPGYHSIQYVDYSAQSDTRKRYAEDDL